MSRLSHGTASLENLEAPFPSPVIAAPLGVPESANRCKGEDRTVRAAGTPRTVQVRKLNTMLAMAILFMAPAAARGQSVFAAPQSVFTTSAAQDVTVMAQAAGTVNQVEVLTLGVSGLEFSKGSGALACANAPKFCRIGKMSCGAWFSADDSLVPATVGNGVAPTAVTTSGVAGWVRVW